MPLDMFANFKIASKEEYYPLIINYGGSRPDNGTRKVKISVAGVAMHPQIMHFCY
jgi:hypothetical protein